MRLLWILPTALCAAAACALVIASLLLPHAAQTVALPRAANRRDYVLYVDVPPGCTHAHPCPALYLLDGAMWFNTAKGAAAHAHAPPFVLIGIGYRNPLETPARRKFDFTPAFGPGAKPGRATGGAQAFLAVLRDEIIPYAETHYPIASAHRALVGHSYGGLFAAYSVLQAPDLFDRALIVSPALWFDNYRTFSLAPAPSARDRVIVCASDAPPRGNPAMARDTARLERELGRLPGVHASVLLYPGTEHVSVAPHALADALPNLAGDNAPPAP